MIIGQGGQALVVGEIAQLSGVHVVRYVNEKEDAVKIREIEGVSTAEAGSTAQFVVALGDNRRRESLTRQIFPPAACDSGAFWTQELIHPSASVSPTARIGCGTVVHAGAVIGPGATVGDHCIVNSRAIVEHECVLEDFSSLAPGAVMGGRSHLGRGAFLGMSATVLQGRRVGDWSVVGASSLVLKDVQAKALVYGIPASCIRQIDDTYSPFAR